MHRLSALQLLDVAWYLCTALLYCRYGAYRRSMETTAEAKAWEEAKVAVG